MKEWLNNVDNTITIVTSKAVNLKAYYININDTSTGYRLFPGTWSQFLDKYTFNASISTNGTYIIKVLDLNNQIKQLHVEVKVVDELSGIDANIVSVTGTSVTDIYDFQADTSHLPTLDEIESSTILAKESSVNIIENIVNTLPQLQDVRNELVNVTYGKLEITNNQLTIWDKDGTVISIFDLFDKNGQPTMNAVYRREVIL